MKKSISLLLALTTNVHSMAHPLTILIDNVKEVKTDSEKYQIKLQYIDLKSHCNPHKPLLLLNTFLKNNTSKIKIATEEIQNITRYKLKKAFPLINDLLTIKENFHKIQNECVRIRSSLPPVAQEDIKFLQATEKVESLYYAINTLIKKIILSIPPRIFQRNQVDKKFQHIIKKLEKHNYIHNNSNATDEAITPTPPFYYQQGLEALEQARYTCRKDNNATIQHLTNAYDNFATFMYTNKTSPVKITISSYAKDYATKLVDQIYQLGKQENDDFIYSKFNEYILNISVLLNEL